MVRNGTAYINLCFIMGSIIILEGSLGFLRFVMKRLMPPYLSIISYTYIWAMGRIIVGALCMDGMAVNLLLMYPPRPCFISITNNSLFRSASSVMHLKTLICFFPF